jgi:L-ascorbate metabolism protein UlaG (beta-lactamase superfamily)/pimeloyl-ACP methyl ester carboxylesterase/sugar lactone lactonase YvrE
MRRCIYSIVVLTWLAIPAHAQPSYAPPNDVPAPYLPGTSWGELPDGRRWGATAGVDIAPDGSIWAYDRCGGNQNGCVGSKLTAILHFDPSGKLSHHFGADLFNFPHGFHVDRDGNVWVTDHGTNPPNGRGQVVIKFSPEGKVLLTLGTPGVAGDGPDKFNQPSDVLVAPNGDIFVADGHAPGPAARIVKFDRTGKFIKSWGSLGAGDDQLNGPHALAMDSQGRLFVGDRSNNRVQVFDQEGKLLASWKQFGRPSGIYIDRDDTIYVTDSESRSDNKPGQYGHNPGVNRGIRIGSVKDGKVTAIIPDPSPIGISSTSEGVAVDRTGAVYGAEVAPRDMKKYVKAPPSTTVISASGGDITVTAIMHGSVQIEHAGKVIHVDPAMGDLKKAKDADLILVTDVHEDHLSLAGIADVQKAGTSLVIPKAAAAIVARADAPAAQVIANGQSRSVAGVAIEAVPMYNLQRKLGNEPFHTKGRGNGYVITLGGKRLYFAGDTECVPEIKALRNIDAAFLPMNVPFTMPPSEAAECAKAFTPKMVIPYHFQGSRFADFSAALKGSAIEVRELNWYPVVFHPDVVAVDRPGKIVEVAGRRMHVHCTGQGPQTVVLIGGFASFAFDWMLVQPELAKTTRVCSYDVAGAGWSDFNRPLETLDGAVSDLHGVLAAAGEKPPYLFVGVGSGAMFARAYDLTYPKHIAGFVLIEPDHEDQFALPVNGKPAPLWSLTAADFKKVADAMRPPPGTAPPPMMPPPATGAPYDKLSKEVLMTRITFETRMFKAAAAGDFDRNVERMEADRQAFVRLHEQASAAGALGLRPLVVLAGANTQDFGMGNARAKVAALSTNSVVRTAARSGREVHLYAPADVVRAVQDVLTAIKTNGKLLP